MLDCHRKHALTKSNIITLSVKLFDLRRQKTVHRYHRRRTLKVLVRVTYYVNLNLRLLCEKRRDMPWAREHEVTERDTPSHGFVICHSH